MAEDLFERGLCLPSGTAMTNVDLDRVIETILKSRAKTPQYHLPELRGRQRRKEGYERGFLGETKC